MVKSSDFGTQGSPMVPGDRGGESGGKGAGLM